MSTAINLNAFASFARRSFTGPLTGNANLSLVDWLNNHNIFRHTDAGVPVTPDIALTLPVVYACVRIVTDSMATAPLHMFELDGNNKNRVRNNPISWLVSEEPNPEMTAAQFWAFNWASEELRGNGFAEIVREDKQNPNSKPVALWPLLASQMEVLRMGREKVYKYTTLDGEVIPLRSHQVMHSYQISIDGLVGLSKVNIAANAIGLGLAQNKYASKFYSNNARPAGVFTTDKVMAQPDQERFLKKWNEDMRGLNNQHRLAILEQGLKYEQIGLSQQDAEFMAGRIFQLDEITRIWGVPPHMVSNMVSATFSNIEEQSIAFVRDTLLPRAIYSEQTVKRALLTPLQRRKFFFEYMLEARMRGDLASQMTSYATAITHSMMKPNEARAKLNMNSDPELDKFFAQANLVILGEEPVEEAPVQIENQAEPEDEDRGCCEHTHERVEHRDIADIVKSRERNRANILPVLRAAASKIVNAEIRELRKIAAKLERDNDLVAFQKAIGAFYMDEAPEITRKHMGPVTESYAAISAGQAAIDIEQIRAVAVEKVFDAEKFGAAYVESFGRHNGAKARREVEKAIRGAIAPVPGPGKATAAIRALENVIQKWTNPTASQAAIQAKEAITRAERIARTQAHRIFEASYRTAMEALGVTRFKWNTIGDNCPLCDELEGNIVGVEQAFALNGDHINPNKPGQKPEDSKPSLLVRSNILNPPLHDGCDCYVTAE